jgi:hypothetical protein
MFIKSFDNQTYVDVDVITIVEKLPSPISSCVSVWISTSKPKRRLLLLENCSENDADKLISDICKKKNRKS